MHEPGNPQRELSRVGQPIARQPLVVRVARSTLTARVNGGVDALVRIALAVALLSLAACASVESPRAPLPQSAPGVPAGVAEWWSVRLQMGFDPAEAVSWYVDALLADQIFAPLIERLGPSFTLWRFHRRAAADETGHQFSFIFYADRDIAVRVSTAISASALLDSLRERNVVREIMLPGAQSSKGTDVAATSDPAWPEAVQRSWPYYIMGVSRSWLALIAQVRASRPVLPSLVSEALLSEYAAINGEVNALWRSYAQHAYLHHLSALFGYQPLLIEERRLIRF